MIALVMLFLLLACSGSPDSDSKTHTDALAEEYLLEGDDAFPESAAWDPEQRAFFTSSLGRGDISRIQADGSSSVFFAGDQKAGRATVGLEVDLPRRRLWACAILVDGSEAGELWILDLDSGKELGRISLASANPEASCTDMNFDTSGVAYVTDRENPAIYKVDFDANTATLWSSDALLTPELIGLNGVTFIPDQSALLVTKYLSPQILRISANDPSIVEEVTLSGEELGGDASFTGADDLVFRGESLKVTLVDRLFTLSSSDNWKTARASSVSIAGGGVTGLVLAEDSLYGANGQAIEFSLGQTATLPFWLHRLE